MGPPLGSFGTGYAGTADGFKGGMHRPAAGEDPLARDGFKLALSIVRVVSHEVV